MIIQQALESSVAFLMSHSEKTFRHSLEVVMAGEGGEGNELSGLVPVGQEGEWFITISPELEKFANIRYGPFETRPIEAEGFPHITVERNNVEATVQIKMSTLFEVNGEPSFYVYDYKFLAFCPRTGRLEVLKSYEVLKSAKWVGDWAV